MADLLIDLPLSGGEDRRPERKRRGVNKMAAATRKNKMAATTLRNKMAATTWENIVRLQEGEKEFFSLDRRKKRQVR